MNIKLFLKFLPYIIIVVLGLIMSFGMIYYTKRITSLTEDKMILETKNSEISNNYNTLQNMYSISMKQAEELQKQQKESLTYVSEVEQALTEIDLGKQYDADAIKLLNGINEYEKCMAKNFKKPYVKCYVENK